MPSAVSRQERLRKRNTLRDIMVDPSTSTLTWLSDGVELDETSTHRSQSASSGTEPATTAEAEIGSRSAGRDGNGKGDGAGGEESEDIVKNKSAKIKKDKSGGLAGARDRVRDRIKSPLMRSLNLDDLREHISKGVEVKWVQIASPHTRCPNLFT